MVDKKEEKKLDPLDAVINAIKKQFGASSIRLNEPLDDVEWVTSSSIGLDRALGKGWAKGRIIEVMADESLGKTTLILHCLAKIQQAGGTVAFLDLEHALDPSYATSLGVDMDKLIVSQPDTAEQALDIVEILVRSGVFQAVALDSVAALIPQAEIEGDMSDQQTGVVAKLMSKAMRKLVKPVADTGCTVFFINQLRSKINFGSQGGRTTTGGNSLKFYASQRVSLEPVWQSSKITDPKTGKVLGINIKAKVIKNKVAAPHQEALLTIRYGRGICPYTEIFNLALEKKLIKVAGSWVKRTDNEESLAQGKERTIALLEENPELFEELKQKVI